MKRTLFPRLAWDGMRKNKRLYVPYLISCTLMVMMYYIMESMSTSPLLHNMRGGTSSAVVLMLGKWVIAFFAMLFLFYTSSFLIRRRNREFGLYNVLGMDKRGVARMMAWETLFTGAGCAALGLALGIPAACAAQTGLFRAIGKDIPFSFTVSVSSIVTTLAVFGVIFAVLLVRSLLLVAKSKPVDLLRSEENGEKPPRGNILLAVLGMALLAGAYYIAVTIKSPLLALELFFVAVMMVIAATYLLFISGSVTLCRGLQRNKRYYYKPEHFISVSSMTYRMKRNGAGLASICILSTMVLVMLSSTASLYFGATDAIAERFPRENMLEFFASDIDKLSDENVQGLFNECDEVFEKRGVVPENLQEYRYAAVNVLLDGTEATTDTGDAVYASAPPENLRSVYFIPAADYNAAMGTDYHPAPGEAIAACNKCTYAADRITLDGIEFKITGSAEFMSTGETAATVALPVGRIMLIVDDLDALRPLDGMINDDYAEILDRRICICYDLDITDDEAISVLDDVTEAVTGSGRLNDELGSWGYYATCLALERDDFLFTYGGLFFLGIMLSVVFIFAAVLIIYYKQVCEGYEDQARFEIMRNVGMTRREIKKSINSQMLTVFAAPLAFAGLHLAFAFPIVWKILQLFAVTNMAFVLRVNLIAFAAFAALYAVVYRITTGAYYAIVAPAGDAE